MRKLLRSVDSNPFLADFLPFQTRIARWGMYNSLSQLLLKCIAPGVPDIYQGNELWDFSLFDPDNRRPVDYDRRRHLLRDLKQYAAESPDLALRVRALLYGKQAGGPNTGLSPGH